MKKLNLFSDLWSSVAGSRKDNGSTRYRLVIVSLSTRYRVWQYSLGKIAAVVCMLLTICVGDMWGALLFEDNFRNVGDNTNSYTSRSGWTLSNTYAHKNTGIRLGTSGGYATKTAITSIEGTKDLAVTIYAAKWNTDASSLIVTVNGTAKINGNSSKTFNSSDLKATTYTSAAIPWDYSYKLSFIITGATSSTTINFATNTFGKRVILGAISIRTIEDAEDCNVFYESWSSTNGTGGNDGSWSGSIASSTLRADNNGWTVSSEGGANACAKFGTTSVNGSAETPAITYVGSNDLVLKFKAAAWNSGSEKVTLNISATNATLDKSSFTLKKGAWTTYTVKLSSVTTGFKIKWEAGASAPCRFFLDEICISEEVDCSIDVSGGSTIILPAGSGTYSAGAWGDNGAPTAYSNGEYLINGYCVSLTQAADYSRNVNGIQLKKYDGIISISDIKSTAGVDVDVVIGSGSGISVALTGSDTKTGQGVGTTTITTYSTTADLTISKPTNNAGYIKTITIRPRSCDDEVALAGGSPTNGTISFSPSGTLGSCAGVVNTTMTITPSTGYYLSAYSSTGVSTSNSPSIATSGSTSEAAQNINLAFAEHTDGTYTANATFSQIMVNSLTLRAQQTDQSDKVGNNITMTCYPKEGQTGGNDPLNHTLNLGLGAVLPANALDKTYSWTVRVKAAGDADWTNVGFDGNVLNSNSIINSFNKNTGHLQIKATLGTAEFTITANDGSGVSAKATITVASVPVTGVSVEPTEMEVYAGQKKPVTITFAPLNATNKSYTTGSYSYVTMRSSGSNPFYIEGNATDVVRNETVTVTTTDGSFTADVNVTVNPLPKVYFVDIVHDKIDFSGVPSTGILIATVSADGLSVTTAKNAPTHSDLSTPATGNACEKSHLHLVGWIIKDWADAHPSASTSEISGAGSGNFYAPEASIDLASKNGKTFYAVWAKQVDAVYTDYVFSCAELTLEPHLVTADAPIFITSAASKKVRSQDYITISGSGLATGATISFPGLDDKFEIKTSTGAALPAVDANGELNVNAHISIPLLQVRQVMAWTK